MVPPLSTLPQTSFIHGVGVWCFPRVLRYMKTFLGSRVTPRLLPVTERHTGVVHFQTYTRGRLNYEKEVKEVVVSVFRSQYQNTPRTRKSSVLIMVKEE